MNDVVQVTDATFEAEVAAAPAVLVDFWAEWCGPCKMMNPILEAVAAHYGDRLRVAKVNVDDNTEMPAKYGVRGIPTLLLFKDGNLLATKVGAVQKTQLIEFIDTHLVAETSEG